MERVFAQLFDFELPGEPSSWFCITHDLFNQGSIAFEDSECSKDVSITMCDD